MRITLLACLLLYSSFTCIRACLTTAAPLAPPTRAAQLLAEEWLGDRPASLLKMVVQVGVIRLHLGTAAALAAR